jgi:hypothetical protein
MLDINNMLFIFTYTSKASSSSRTSYVGITIKIKERVMY